MNPDRPVYHISRNIETGSWCGAPNNPDRSYMPYGVLYPTIRKIAEPSTVILACVSMGLCEACANLAMDDHGASLRHVLWTETGFCGGRNANPFYAYDALKAMRGDNTEIPMDICLTCIRVINALERSGEQGFAIIGLGGME